MALLLLFFLIICLVILILLYKKYVALSTANDNLSSINQSLWKENANRVRQLQEALDQGRQAYEQLTVYANELNEQIVVLEKYKSLEHVREREYRNDALQKSKVVRAGQSSEVMVPFMPDFPYNPKDARFLGNPVDLVIFDGLDNGKVKQIVFGELKTNTSQLNANQRMIRDAIFGGKISWFERRDRNGELVSQRERQR